MPHQKVLARFVLEISHGNQHLTLWASVTLISRSSSPIFIRDLTLGVVKLHVELEDSSLGVKSVFCNRFLKVGQRSLKDRGSFVTTCSN